MNLVHKSGATLTNADGLSRCATQDGRESDAAIKLDAIAELQEDDCLADAFALEEEDLLNMEGEIMEVNILSKFTKAYLCSKCDELIGELKPKSCGACGEAVHVKCLPGKPAIGYWFC